MSVSDIVLNQPQSKLKNKAGLFAAEQGNSSTSTSVNLLGQLESTSFLIIKQRREDVYHCCMTNETYEILNEQDEHIYTVEESGDYCSKCWCGSLRSVVINVKDAQGNTAISFERPLTWKSICLPCCLQVLFHQLKNYSQSIRIMSPSGNLIGSILQEWGLQKTLLVQNVKGETIFLIRSPSFLGRRTSESDSIPIFKSDGKTQVGSIFRYLLEVDNVVRVFSPEFFGVNFPAGIDPPGKALLVAATFMMKYMLFEEDRCC